jgi:hypothetical protein
MLSKSTISLAGHMAYHYNVEMVNFIVWSTDSRCVTLIVHVYKHKPKILINRIVFIQNVFKTCYFQ